MKEKNIVNPDSPVAGGLLIIHRLISRALKISIGKCDEYLRKKEIPADEAEGFNMYLTTLIHIMHAHHMGEDDVVFPYTSDLIKAPYTRLKADHKSMAVMLDNLEKDISDSSVTGIARLRRILSQIDELWGPHIKAEEDNFSAEKICAVMSRKEQKDLAERIGKHSQQSSGPGPITLPFVVYNLEEGDRKEFLRQFPWVLKNVMIPFVWKKQWQPMKPFHLLHS